MYHMMADASSVPPALQSLGQRASEPFCDTIVLVAVSPARIHTSIALSNTPGRCVRFRDRAADALLQFLLLFDRRVQSLRAPLPCAFSHVTPIAHVPVDPHTAIRERL
jgi:hypothetical protein